MQYLKSNEIRRKIFQGLRNFLFDNLEGDAGPYVWLRSAQTQPNRLQDLGMPGKC